MNEEIESRKRFHKPYHFMIKAGKNPASCLAEIFKNFHLDDFRREIDLWQYIALSNDQSAYDEGCTREDLIDFIQGLHKLIEVFYIINCNYQKENRAKKKLAKHTKKTHTGMNLTVSLTDEEKERPFSVIKQFCKTFKKSYVKIELLDLLDAVMIYDGDKKVYKGNLVLFYQHLHYLIKLAYSMNKNKTFVKG